MAHRIHEWKESRRIHSAWVVHSCNCKHIRGTNLCICNVPIKNSSCEPDEKTSAQGLVLKQNQNRLKYSLIQNVVFFMRARLNTEKKNPALNGKMSKSLPVGRRIPLNNPMIPIKSRCCQQRQILSPPGFHNKRHNMYRSYLSEGIRRQSASALFAVQEERISVQFHLLLKIQTAEMLLSAK